MSGYTRQSVADIVNGANITAPPLNAEFNTLAAAFNGTTGHTHTGGIGDGPKIELTTSVAGYLPQVHGGVGGRNNTQATVNPTSSNDANSGYAPGSVWINATTGRLFICMVNTASAAVWVEAMGIIPQNRVTPENTNTVDIGSPTLQFKDIYIDGTGYIDSVSGDTLTLTSNASVGGNLSVTGTFLVQNTATFQEPVGFSKAVTASDNVTVQKNLTVNGDTNLGNQSSDVIRAYGLFATSVAPNASGAYDLGYETNQWRNLWIDGTANIDSLNADLVNIDDGSIDNTDIGAGTPATAAFTTLDVTTSADFAGATISNLGTVTTADIDGGSIDGVTIGTNSAVTDLRVDNIKVDGNAITSTNTNGNISVTPNGTGAVVISKADINSGTIDGTTIGASSHTSGKFTTLQSTGQATLATVDINGGTIDGTAIGASAPSTGAFTTVSASGGFTGALSGNVTGNVTGNLTGNVTGDVTGNISGDVTSTGTSTFNDVTISGTLNMDAGTTATIQNLSAPVNATDAATKGYVDTSVADLIDLAPGALDTLNELAAALGDDANFATNVYQAIDNQVNAAGDTMTGTLDMGANKVTTTLNPTTDSELTRKAYVDAQDALQVSRSGDSMSGALAMGGNNITGLAEPVNPQDATTKNYIDSVFGSTQSAAASATAAAVSETNAATSEANALASANAAEADRITVAGIYDQFDDRYLGSKTVAPSVDNDGNALLIGALYFNETTGSMQVYSSSGWVPAGSSVNGTSARFKYVATANQNTFVGADANGEVLAYDSGYIDVFLNGVRLSNGDDFTATTGTAIQLLFNASENDVLEIVAYGTFQLADIAINDMTDVNTAGLADGDVLVYNATSGDFEPGTAPIDDATVVTAKIADDAVTQAKLADNSVGSAQIIDGSVNDAEIGTVNATAIDYNNTVSGISANTVQEAIDYLNTLSGGSSGDVASYTRDKFVATAGQTTFTTSNGYTLGYLQVFVNGILLDITDYTANDESTIVLAEAADAGDEVVAIALDSFAIAELLRVTDISASAGTNSLQIDANGRIVSPNGIEVRNADYENGLKINRNLDVATVGAAGVKLKFGAINNGTDVYPVEIVGVTDNTGTAGWLDVNLDGSNKFTVKANGNVGIGSSSPSALLHLASASPRINFTDTDVPYDTYISANSGHMYYASHNVNRDHVFTNNSDGRDCMRITGDGYVTTPYQPAFEAHLSGSASFSSNFVIPANVTTFNQGNHYSTSTYKFTAPVDGVYLFTMSIGFDGGTGTDDTQFMAFGINNVVPYGVGNPTAATNIKYFTRSGIELVQTFVRTIKLSAGDAVDARLMDVQSTVNINSGVLTGYLLG